MLTRFVTDTDIDVVLMAGRYTLLDRSAADALLPAAVRRGVSVIAGECSTPACSLPRPRATYDYRPAAELLVARALHLQNVCARFGVPLRAAAARFPLTHPAIASVLIGARSAAETSDAVGLWAIGIPPDLWPALAADSDLLEPTLGTARRLAAADPGRRELQRRGRVVRHGYPLPCRPHLCAPRGHC